jgi:hypothetical protein
VLNYWTGGQERGAHLTAFQVVSTRRSTTMAPAGGSPWATSSATGAPLPQWLWPHGHGMTRATAAHKSLCTLLTGPNELPGDTLTSTWPDIFNSEALTPVAFAETLALSSREPDAAGLDSGGMGSSGCSNQTPTIYNPSHWLNGVSPSPSCLFNTATLHMLPSTVFKHTL